MLAVLVGMSFFWDILTDSPREDIASMAIEIVLSMSYLNVIPRLKKEPAQLHKKFIQNCYTRLDQVIIMIFHARLFWPILYNLPFGVLFSSHSCFLVETSVEQLLVHLVWPNRNEVFSTDQ